MGIFSEFVLSAAATRQFPTDNLPEVALVGRSNVGKSSLINSLLRSSKLARTSNTPGRTQTLNFYRIWPEGKPNFGDARLDPEAGEERFSLRGSAREAAIATGAFYFVDMPGYGYARVSESQKQAWRKLIEQYLMTRENLKAVLQVVDLRHPPSRDDIAMWEWLRHFGKVRLCVATKADKLSRNERPTNLRTVAQDLGIKSTQAPSPTGPASADEEAVLMYSAEDGMGREQLMPWILSVIKQ